MLSIVLWVLIGWFVLDIIVLCAPLYVRREYDTAVLAEGSDMESVGVMGFSYKYMAEIVNVLYDLNCEVHRPIFCRFWRYPYPKARQILHSEIVNTFVRRMEALDMNDRMEEKNER